MDTDVIDDDLIISVAESFAQAENESRSMSYPAEVLNELAPKAREMLNIPKEHYTGLIVGFGYPEIEYARGVQKDRTAKTHRYSERILL